MVVATISEELDGPVGTVTLNRANLRTLRVDVAFDTMGVNPQNAGGDKCCGRDLLFDVANVSDDDVQVEATEPSSPGHLQLGDLT